ncbi:hypothetical protein ES704_01404 [subsurface metagenome]|jgi:hypothetical protein
MALSTRQKFKLLGDTYKFLARHPRLLMKGKTKEVDEFEGRMASKYNTSRAAIRKVWAGHWGK